MLTETPSDASDYEAKIKVLNEELKRRKLEAEGLKKEQKKRRKDRMREQEASLKRQIEVLAQVERDGGQMRKRWWSNEKIRSFRWLKWRK